MATKHSITVSPEEIERWLEDFGPGGFGDPYKDGMTEISVDDAERIAREIAEDQYSDDPAARSVDFAFVRGALLEGGYHLALSDKLEPFISTSFRNLKSQPR
jgi:hypothetical protein